VANKTPFQKAAIFALKIAVSAVLLYLLGSKVGGKAIVDNIMRLDPLLFVVACGLYLFATYLSSVRWRLLIPTPVPTVKLFSMYLIGGFFNTYMPGTIGGDAVKAYYLKNTLKKIESGSGAFLPEGRELTIAIASVFMDRYVGVLALLLVNIAVLPIGYSQIKGLPVSESLIWIMLGVSAVSLLAGVVMFKFRIRGRLAFFSNIYDYFDHYSSKKSSLFATFFLSVVLQFINFVAVYILARGLSINISFAVLIIFMPAIVLISFVPLSISGLGIREGAFAFFLGAVGVSTDMAVTLSLVWFLSMVCVGAIGMFEYLRFKTVLGGEEKE
jgi:uncharacterized protein (TIRG00374 family)